MTGRLTEKGRQVGGGERGGQGGRAGMSYARPDVVQPMDGGREGGSRREPCVTCCCCLSITIVILIAVALAIALFIVAFVKPRKPQLDLQSVSIQDFHVDESIQGFINAAVYLSMNITLIFSASNPNKVGIEYSSTNFRCLYSTALLGVATVPSFYQPAHSKKTVKAFIVVNRLNILQSSSADLLRDATINDNVPLNVNGPVRARLRILGINSPKVKVSIKCEIVLSPREQVVKSKECNVDQVHF